MSTEEEPVRSKKWVITETRTIVVEYPRSSGVCGTNAMEMAFGPNGPRLDYISSDHTTRTAVPVES